MIDRFYLIQIMPPKGVHDGVLSVSVPETGIRKDVTVLALDTAFSIGRKISELIREFEREPG
jgi:hypothetical protein